MNQKSIFMIDNQFFIFRTLTLVYNKNKENHEILTVSGEPQNLKKFQEIVYSLIYYFYLFKIQVLVRQKFLSHKGPLSYNPARLNRPSLLSTEQTNTNYNCRDNMFFWPYF